VARLKVLQQHQSRMTEKSQGEWQFKESFRDSHQEPLEHKAVVSLPRFLHIHVVAPMRRLRSLEREEYCETEKFVERRRCGLF
jgi:hypothetical protein